MRRPRRFACWSTRHRLRPCLTGAGIRQNAPVIRLYRAPFSTNCERVLLALGIKGLAAESVWISYDDRSPVEAVSGQGLVPVLDYDGEIITESMDIVRFLDGRHPEPPLYPSGDVQDFVDWFNGTWKGPPNEIEAELEKSVPDQAKVERLAGEMIDHLDRFEGMLSDRDYLIGDELTAADLCAFPFLKFATLHDAADDELFHLILRDHQRDGRNRPRLAAWIARLDLLPRWPLPPAR
jgi:glutathione S-transferase